MFWADFVPENSNFVTKPDKLRQVSVGVSAGGQSKRFQLLQLFDLPPQIFHLRDPELLYFHVSLLRQCRRRIGQVSKGGLTSGWLPVFDRTLNL